MRLSVAVLVATGFLPLAAQVDTGSILGTVRDQSGGAIPNAKVTLTNEGTGVSATTQSRPDGSYLFTPIRIGTYSVSAEFTGFRVVRPGAFVRCAVTNVPIPLEELKYWSVEHQEAYSTPEAVLQRLFAERQALAAGHHHFDRFDVVARRSDAHRMRTGRIQRQHAADRRHPGP